MHYLALINDQEVELADEDAVAESFRRGEIDETTWIKAADVESDWETLGESFPELARRGDAQPPSTSPPKRLSVRDLRPANGSHESRR